MKVNVLGTEYEIVKVDESKDPILKDADGYCDNTIKTCVIGDFQSEQNSVKDLDTYTKKVIRHELTHAFLFESGLAESSWAKNEEIVDWIAYQFPKLLQAFTEAGAI